MSNSEEHSSTRESVQVLLQEAWKFVCSLGENRSDNTLGSPWLVNQQWRYFRDASTKLVERSHNQKLGVAVVALTKSGKSTLLNALLGCACLPTNNVPETARVCFIRHGFSGGPVPRLVEPSGRLSEGQVAVCQRLQELNEEKRSSGNAWKMESALEIIAPIYALSGVPGSASIALVDTPGPNEAKSEFLRHMVHVLLCVVFFVSKDYALYKVEKLLEDVDAVIYVLDYTKLKTVEEEEMLQDIQKINPALVERMSQRMFFVVNKFDVASTGQGLNEAETKEYVFHLLRDAGFNVRREQIMLISANNALLSRLIITDKADPDTRTKFGRLAFGMEFEKVMEKREWRARAERMLEISGISQLEDRVVSFLYTHSGSIKLLSLLDDEAMLLQEIGNVASSFKAALSRSLGDMRAGMDRLKSQLDSTLLEFDIAKRELLAIQEDVVVKVRDALSRLKNRLLTCIQYALSVESESDSATPPNPGWEGIHEDFVLLMGIQETDSVRAQDLLQELYNEVTSQIQSEIGIAWATIEELGGERHRELIDYTNSHLGRLSHLIEAVISKELGIHLDPIDITFKPPTIDEFRDKLHELLNSGINKEVRERNSLCRYFAGATYTVYSFQANSIRNHFETVMLEASDHSLEAIQGVVQKHIAQQINVAEARLRDYGDRYKHAVQAAIDTRIAHITANASTMQRVLQDVSMVKKLRAAASELQTVVEASLQVNGEVVLVSKDSTGSILEGEIYDESLQSPGRGDSLVRVGSGKIRYVPPRSRFQAQDAVLAETLHAERTDSGTLLDLTDTHWESPRSFPTHRREGQGSHWRNRSLGGGGGSGQFSPRSDFFRSFDKAHRGGRSAGSGGSGGSGRGAGGGRGKNFHKRSESWN